MWSDKALYCLVQVHQSDPPYELVWAFSNWGQIKMEGELWTFANEQEFHSKILDLIDDYQCTKAYVLTIQGINHVLENCHELGNLSTLFHQEGEVIEPTEEEKSRGSWFGKIFQR